MNNPFFNPSSLGGDSLSLCLSDVFMRVLYEWVKAKIEGREEDARKVGDEISSFMALIRDFDCLMKSAVAEGSDPVKEVMEFIISYYLGDDVPVSFAVLEKVAAMNGWR